MNNDAAPTAAGVGGGVGIISTGNSNNAPADAAATAKPPPPSPHRISRRSIITAPTTVVASSSSSTSAGGGSGPRVVPRPPLNVNLKIAIIRSGNDVVVCEDPEHPGRTKQIVINHQQLLDATSTSSSSNGNGITKEGDTKQHSFAAAAKEKQDSSSSSSSNKKEIPVPTITTVRRYDTDIPPNYPTPISYVRHVCPTYEDVMNDSVEYNIDVEDETWWRNHLGFGPWSKAKILMPGDHKDGTSFSFGGGDSTTRAIIIGSTTKDATGGASSSKKNTKVVVEPPKVRNKKGKFVKQKSGSSSTTKKLLVDGNTGNINADAFKEEDSMDLDRTDSDVSIQQQHQQHEANSTTAATSQQSNNNYNYDYQNLTIEQVILLNPKYLHSPHSTQTLHAKYNPKLPLKTFESMIDILEKETGFEFTVTNSQAQDVFVQKLPELVDIFGPLSAKERRMENELEERHYQRWLRLHHKSGGTNAQGTVDDTDTNDGQVVTIQSSSSAIIINETSTNNTLAQQQKKIIPSSYYPTLAPPITLPTAITSVYNYWMSKRTRLKKPLLRRYWPPTAASNVDPHQVFRQHAKENKRRLRKKKQNDMEAYKKMKQLKFDFERVGVLCELMGQRECVSELMVELSNEYFEERLHGFVDTTGSASSRRIEGEGSSLRSSSLLLDHRRNRVESVLNGVPTYFDDGPIIKLKVGKKRKRSSHQQQQQGGWNVDSSRDPSRVPHGSMAGAHHHHHLYPGVPGGIPHGPAHGSMANLPPGMTHPPPLAILPPPPPPKPVVVAGHDGGLPVPNFLQPLASREIHSVTHGEDDCVPTMPSYINGKETTTIGDAANVKFRHRPRLGRGGRIVIDRVPCPSDIGQATSLHDGFSTALLPATTTPTVVTYGSPMPRSGYHTCTLGADGPNYSIDGSPDKYGPGRSPNQVELRSAAASGSGMGTDAKSAPRVPPAKSLLELLPKSLGNNGTSVLSRKIEEICALGLMEDVQMMSTSGAGLRLPHGGGPASGTNAAASSTKSSGHAATTSPTAATLLSDDFDEVLVPIEDWMEAPDGLKLYGAEKFVLGPI